MVNIRKVLSGVGIFCVMASANADLPEHGVEFLSNSVVRLYNKDSSLDVDLYDCLRRGLENNVSVNMTYRGKGDAASFKSVKNVDTVCSAVFSMSQIATRVLFTKEPEFKGYLDQVVINSEGLGVVFERYDNPEVQINNKAYTMSTLVMDKAKLNKSNVYWSVASCTDLFNTDDVLVDSSEANTVQQSKRETFTALTAKSSALFMKAKNNVCATASLPGVDMYHEISVATQEAILTEADSYFAKHYLADLKRIGLY